MKDEILKIITINREDDPVFSCPVYTNIGCAQIDGFLCSMSTCTILHNYNEGRIRPENLTVELSDEEITSIIDKELIEATYYDDVLNENFYVVPKEIMLAFCKKFQTVLNLPEDTGDK